MVTGRQFGHHAPVFHVNRYLAIQHVRQQARIDEMEVPRQLAPDSFRGDSGDSVGQFLSRFESSGAEPRFFS